MTTSLWPCFAQARDINIEVQRGITCSRRDGLPSDPATGTDIQRSKRRLETGTPRRAGFYATCRESPLDKGMPELLQRDVGTGVSASKRVLPLVNAVSQFDTGYGGR